MGQSQQVDAWRAGVLVRRSPGVNGGRIAEPSRSCRESDVETQPGIGSLWARIEGWGLYLFAARGELGVIPAQMGL